MRSGLRPTLGKMVKYGFVKTVRVTPMPTERKMCNPPDKPCDREWTDEGWWCMNDHTGCIFNDGHNTCTHRGDSLSPLGGE